MEIRIIWSTINNKRNNSVGIVSVQEVKLTELKVRQRHSVLFGGMQVVLFIKAAEYDLSSLGTIKMFFKKKLVLRNKTLCRQGLLCLYQWYHFILRSALFQLRHLDL